MLSPLLDAPVVAGPLPTAIAAAGTLAAAVLLVGRTRSWWLRRVPLALLVGVAVAATAALAVALLRPFPDPLPVRVLVWIAVFGAAAGLGWTHRRSHWGRRAIAAVAVTAVLLTCLMKVNAFYGYRTTIGGALGIPAANQVDLAAVPAQVPLVSAAGGPLARSWHGAVGMPATGRIATVAIPGSRSHFDARPAWVYLPPAYLGSPRAHLPVLVLVSGQPGGPADWLLAGRLAEVMDAYAAAHDGLAPVVVVPDANGSDLGNTLCLDSRLGQAETYLADDVPAWLADHLQVDTTHLAIGGFSFGGTCALQLALRHPHTYPTFLDVAGQSEPTLGDYPSTVAATFGTDVAAFEQVDPVDELQARTFPGSAAVLVAGRDDDYRAQAEQVAEAAQAAGIDVTLRELPGEHTWALASEALASALPWIAGRTGLDVPVPAPQSDSVPVPTSEPEPAG